MCDGQGSEDRSDVDEAPRGVTSNLTVECNRPRVICVAVDELLDYAVHPTVVWRDAGGVGGVGAGASERTRFETKHWEFGACCLLAEWCREARARDIW